MGPKTIKKLTGETNANPEISALKTQAELLDTQELSDMVEFTETDGIDSTKKELKELSDRSATDSIFSGLLLMKLVNAEQLIKTSVTGKPCQRFAKARNPNEFAESSSGTQEAYTLKTLYAQRNTPTKVEAPSKNEEISSSKRE
ncbi:uncharacterized protein LOC129724340 isoform X5 [Wyeomyia smithii]|uniref:uncharacterized protein LOC129724340 isoform X5 n=1 Tax=Wyeomyia smithii TaxID=174621 RepID=UPI0024681111|nr:uncharacterized protein LOC129724340 isoform X5 [Wyeomyia smithii]